MKKTEKKRSTTYRPYLRRLLIVGLWLGVAVGAYLSGRYLTSPRATAQTPPYSFTSTARATNAQRQYEADREKRVVAYIYGKTPITRQELGEYLISRHGAKALTLLINRRIIEHECKRRGITVTPEEVEATLKTDLKKMNVTRDRFISGVLKRYKKTMYEWKEDVIYPRLMLTKLSRGRVNVTPEDLNQAFEAHYGEKVDCQMILWPINEKERVIRSIWPKIAKDEKEFDRAARHCFVPSVAARGGRLQPIGRNTTGDEQLEKLIFDLKEGEVSHVQETSDGKMVVVVKCLKRIPPVAGARLADKRDELEREIFEKKVSLELNKLFGELRKEAKPKLYVKRFNAEDGIVTDQTAPVQPRPQAPTQPTSKKPTKPLTFKAPSSKAGKVEAPAAPPTPVALPSELER